MASLPSLPSPCTARRSLFPAKINHRDKPRSTTSPINSGKSHSGIKKQPRRRDITSFEIDFSRTLGTGSFGSCFGVKGDERVAIKVLGGESGRRECFFYDRLDHKGVISVYAHGSTCAGTYAIAMERCLGGELFDRVSYFPLPDEQTVRRIFCELLDAVEHCHSRGVAHRDIKLENILFADTSGGPIRLIDFGLAHQYPPAQGGGYDRSMPLRDRVGSKSYTAPEVLDGLGYDGFAADMWSCGVVLFTLLTGTFPYPDEPPANLDLRLVRSGLDLPAAVVGLLDSLFEADPARRPSAGEARRHAWCAGASAGGARRCGASCTGKDDWCVYYRGAEVAERRDPSDASDALTEPSGFSATHLDDMLEADARDWEAVAENTELDAYLDSLAAPIWSSGSAATPSPPPMASSATPSLTLFDCLRRRLGGRGV